MTLTGARVWRIDTASVRRLVSLLLTVGQARRIAANIAKLPEVRSKRLDRLGLPRLRRKRVAHALPSCVGKGRGAAHGATNP